MPHETKPPHPYHSSRYSSQQPRQVLERRHGHEVHSRECLLGLIEISHECGGGGGVVKVLKEHPKAFSRTKTLPLGYLALETLKLTGHVTAQLHTLNRFSLSLSLSLSFSLSLSHTHTFSLSLSAFRAVRHNTLYQFYRKVPPFLLGRARSTCSLRF